MRFFQAQCLIENLSIFNKLGIDFKDSVTEVSISRHTKRFFNAIILLILRDLHFLPRSPIIVPEETACFLNSQNIWHVNFKTQRNRKYLKIVFPQLLILCTHFSLF